MDPVFRVFSNVFDCGCMAMLIIVIGVIAYIIMKG